MLWFLAKVAILLFCFIWLRGTLPRIRYDQLMAFGWKVLIPVSLAWIMIIATMRVFRTHGGSEPVYIVAGAIIVVLMVLVWTADSAAERRRTEEEAQEADAAEPGAAMASLAEGSTLAPATSAPRSFPIPPMDLPHYHGFGVTVPAAQRPLGTGDDPEPTANGTSKEASGV
jgi:NADH-quinone oxidoreductase subunit H